MEKREDFNECALLDEEIHPLSPKIISKQATLNIGTIGHVAHGKSTVVRAISGVQTVRFKNEKERNITIKLGYANAKIFKCTGDCKPPKSYASYGGCHQDDPPCEHCAKPMELIRHVSFVDCPGHDILMATMLNGAAVMDAALLLIAGNESCPQPQTSEHLAAVEIVRLKHILVLQNKVELIKESQAQQQKDHITRFVAGTSAGNAPIIPISAILRLNIDVLCEYIANFIPMPVRDLTAPPLLTIVRSFDVNKPGETYETLCGGVAGGTLQCGVLRVGDLIEVRPGMVSRNNAGSIQCRSIFSRIVSMYAEQNDLELALPGGLIGVGTEMDPTLTRSDRLVGQVLGHPGKLPGCFAELHMSYYLLRRLLGVKTQDSARSQRVSKLRSEEFLMVNIGSTSVGGRIENITTDIARLTLYGPVCALVGSKVALSRRVDKHWRLIGFGTLKVCKALVEAC